MYNTIDLTLKVLYNKYNNFINLFSILLIKNTKYDLQTFNISVIIKVIIKNLFNFFYLALFYFKLSRD